MQETEKAVQKKRTAKRKLSNISFEQQGAHIALCSAEQGTANNAPYQLALKAANFSEEFLEKASKVTVEMEITEYLSRFFQVYGADAEVLARTLGFTTSKQEKMQLEQQEQALEDKEDKLYPEYPSWDADEKDWENYINSKVASIAVMKAVYEADSYVDVLASLNEEQYLQLLKDQEMLEKAFKKIEKQKESSKVAKATKVEPQQIASVENKVEVETTSVSKNKTKEKDMTQEVQEIEQEVISKSQFEAIEKAFAEQKEELLKAQELIKAFQAEKQAAIEKARKEQVVQAVKDEAKAEVLFKAVKDAQEEDFQAVVKALSELAVAVEKSELFQEQGASVSEQEQPKEDPVRAVIKAKYGLK